MLARMKARNAHAKRRTTFRACAALTLCFSQPAGAGSASIEPGISRYTLDIEPFAEHAGENAIDLTYAPDASGRIFVSTQSGQIYAFDREGISLGVFLDVKQSAPGFMRSDGGYNGLMYIAFHPDFARPGTPGFGKLYTSHQVAVSDDKPDYDSANVGANGDSDVRFVIARWQVDAEHPDRIDPASYRRVMLLNFHTTSSNPHAVGELAFNPYAKPGEADYGKLYIGIGDSNNRNQSTGTDLRYTQQPDNPFAKLLRIDPIEHDGKPYRIPDDNPYQSEVYAMGLRNPQNFSFALDLEGKPVIFEFDIGAGQAEEINIIRSGGNYGWARYEGLSDYDARYALNGPSRHPVVQYGHAFPTRPGEQPTGGLAAIVGGFVVSDPDDSAFQGQLIFADLPRGTFMHANAYHALSVEAGGTQSRPYIMNVRLGDKLGTFADVIGAERGDTRFGVDDQGRLFLISKQTQTIYKTRLVYTGLPVQASPQVEPGSANRAMAVPMAVIIGVVVFLAIELVWVLVSGPRFKPEASAAA